MIKSNVKLVLAVLLVISVFSFLVWFVYDTKRGASAVTSSRFLEKQLEANNEEASRSSKASKTGNTILTEPHDDFIIRMQRYFTSGDKSSERATTGLQTNKSKRPSDLTDRLYKSTEAETKSVLQDDGLLQADYSKLLCDKAKQIEVYDEYGLRVLYMECPQ